MDNELISKQLLGIREALGSIKSELESGADSRNYLREEIKQIRTDIRSIENKLVPLDNLPNRVILLETDTSKIKQDRVKALGIISGFGLATGSFGGAIAMLVEWLLRGN